MLGLLEQLVNIESPTEHPDGVNCVGEALGEQLSQLGFEVRRIPSTRFGDHVVADGGPREGSQIFLIGHMDTVYPVGTGWGFSTNGATAFGPGVIDMKGGDVVLIFALKALHAVDGISTSIRVVFNSDEEFGSPESGVFIPDLARTAQYAFVLEPSEPDGTLVSERKGAGVFRVAVYGKAAHAGQEPETGLSANLELVHLLLSAADLADPARGTTVNIGRIEGGTAAAIVPESAYAEIDVRVPNLEEQRRIEQEMEALTRANRLRGTQIEVTGGWHRYPMPLLPATRTLMGTVSAAAKACGQTVTFGRSGAVSDGNNLVAAGVPTLDGVGPVGGRAHSRDEYMEVDTLFDRTVLLALALSKLGSGS
jgi:glutamate carboxypeptidase